MDVSTDPSTWRGVDPAELPRRELPQLVTQRHPGFQVIINQQVLDHIHWHGSTITDREVCGILMGDVYQDDIGPFLYVEAMIEGTHASEAAAQVTFTAETWADMQQIIDKRYPDQRVVGWYHTHPNFGIFLSEMDLFIHGNFFNLPWQIAIVFDPIRREEGLFLWKDGGTVRESFLVDMSAPAAIAESGDKPLPPIEPKKPMAPSPAKSWGGNLAVVVSVFLLAGLGYFLVWPDKFQAVEEWLSSLLSR